MQFSELHKMGRDKILEAWGMPKSMLGIVEDVNRANAEASEYMFSKWLVEERLDRWRDLLNFEILPQFGATAEGLEWDYDSPVPENSDQENAAITAKSAALALLTDKGYNPSDLLRLFGWPELGYSRPEPKVVQLPPGQGGQDG
jgi:phage portal protein BeeE